MAAPFKYNAETLQQKYIEYIEYMADKYDVKVDYIKSGERAGELIEIKLPKIKSIQGFCNYAKIENTTFYDYCNKDSENIDTELYNIATHIRMELLEYRASLGLNNIINPNLLMAIDGIKQVVDVQQNISINSLPVHINNSIIDLTSAEYTVINDVSTNKLIELTENTLTE